MHEVQPDQSDQPASPVRPAVDMATAIWLLRSARGLSQRAMAKRMAIARTYISKLERNSCVPSPTQVRCIAGALEVPEYCLVALATVLSAGWHSQEAFTHALPALRRSPLWKCGTGSEHNFLIHAVLTLDLGRPSYALCS